MGAIQMVTYDGSVMLICIALLGGSIGDLVNWTTKDQQTRTGLVGCCVLLAIWSGLAFSGAAAKEQSTSYIFYTSLLTFTGTIFCCIASLLVPNGDSER